MGPAYGWHNFGDRASIFGLGMAGARVLEVKGRKSGEWRRTPVNPLSFEGKEYLVAPRGPHQWVRNPRVSGESRLAGRRTESFTATELSDEEKPALLRAYLKKWKWELGAFFDSVGADAPESELQRIAPDHPVFRITARRRVGLGRPCETGTP